jgi:hypothetical protein
MLKEIGAGLLVLTLMVGCSGKNTLSITESKDALGQPIIKTEYVLSDTGMYHKSVSESDQAKASLAETKATSISNQDLSELSTDAQAIIKYKNSEEISKIEVTPYSGEAPTTAADMGVAAIEVVPAVVSGTVKGIAIVEAGKTVREVVNKDTVKVESSKDTAVSMNREETHQTQVVSAAQEGGATGAPQQIGAKEPVTLESEEGIVTDANGMPCDGADWGVYGGECMSNESARERGLLE